MKYVLLAALGLLSACQSAHYANYSGDDSATLVFTSDGVTAQPVICAAEKQLRNTDLSVGLGGYKMLEDLNEAMKKSPEVRTMIPANSTVTAGFRHSQRGRLEARKLCLRTVSFDSVTGETYRLHLEKSPACAISAFRLDGDVWVEQSVKPSDGACP
ncbi:MAG: hypothetical protein ACK4SX_03135 [Alcanivoracaceae bacterium]